jgi:hypothetical protein
VTGARAVTGRPYLRDGRATPAREAGFLPPELQTLLATATLVIDRHVNAGGRCGSCGDRWPCEQAQLADLVLGGF